MAEEYKNTIKNVPLPTVETPGISLMSKFIAYVLVGALGVGSLALLAMAVKALLSVVGLI